MNALSVCLKRFVVTKKRNGWKEGRPNGCFHRQERFRGGEGKEREGEEVGFHSFQALNFPALGPSRLRL